MLCPPPPTLNPVTIFEAARLPHHANPSRAAGSFFGHLRPSKPLTTLPPHPLRGRSLNRSIEDMACLNGVPDKPQKAGWLAAVLGQG
jgi:hypothetical protein